MPDIFLSYNRNDQAIARRFAEGFEREGFSVWWDQTLHSGEAYDKVTEKALEDARAVVVLWSKTSVDSRWVRAEATQADRNGTLVPVMIEPCKRPIMFELTHTAELGKWKGDPGDPAWQAFVADVRRFVHQDPSAVPAANPVVSARRFSNLQIAIAVAILSIVGVLFWAFNHSPGGLDSRSVATAAKAKGAVTLAVVPFANPDGSEEGRVLAFGVAESVRYQLANVSDLSVIAWNSASGIDKEAQGIPGIAKRLGVAYVLQGGVQRQGNLLRVTAHLVEAATERSVWSLRPTSGKQDVFAIQDDIALQVTRALSVSLTPEGQARMRGQGTRNMEAYLAFMEGQDALSTWRKEEAGPAATHFNRALQLDPQFARAMVMLARARQRNAESIGSADARSQVEQSREEATDLIDRALKIDPQLSDGYVERGYLHQFDDPEAAERDYRKAIELSPSNARAYQGLAALIWEDLARRAEVGPLLDRARKLDPLDSELDVTLALFFILESAKFEEADLLLRRVLEREPDYVPALARYGANLEFGLGRVAEAIKVHEKVLEIDAGMEGSRRGLVYEYVLIGDLEQARRVADHPLASPVCRLLAAFGEHRVEEAARLAYVAFRGDIVGAADQQAAVTAIVLDARRSKDYAKASAVLEDALNIAWVTDGEPEVNTIRGGIHDVVSYAGMLRVAGDETRAQALLGVVERTMDEDEAKREGARFWNRTARLRVAAMKPDKNATLSLLEKTCSGPRSLFCWELLEIDPLFTPLHGEPRFKALVENFRRNQEEARRALKK